MAGTKRHILDSRDLDIVSDPDGNEAMAPFDPEFAEVWLRALLGSLRDIILVRDADGVLTYCSPATASVLGLDVDDLVGRPEHELVHPDDREMRERFINRMLLTERPQPPVEVRLHDRTGSWGWFELTDTNLLDHPAVRGIVTCARDITFRKAVAEDLIDLTLRDPLTGLPNRIALLDRLAVALAHAVRNRDTLAVLFCDLDDFKVINDTLGHDIGDGVLVEAASRLQRTRRASDTVARTGGDEFIVLCEGLPGKETATVIASQMRDAINHPFSIDGKELTISISIGIFTVDGNKARGLDPVALVRNADTAMYQAKERGKARWEVFDDALFEQAQQRSLLEADLQAALWREQFVLHYQPVHDLRVGDIVGVEALLRWQHPTRGLLYPSDFMAAAEQSGLMVAIGNWVRHEACAQAQRWRRDYAWDGWVSVNVSARELAEPGLATSVADALRMARMVPSALWLELNESSLLRAGKPAAEQLTALRALGVKLGMDDFGTGFASISNLRRLPMDFLKIDRTFVAELARNGETGTRANSLISALLHLGHTLGLDVIAEGIETEEEHDLLREFGCAFGQGYYFERPAPAARSEILLALRAPPIDLVSDQPLDEATPPVSTTAGSPLRDRAGARSVPPENGRQASDTPR